MKKRNLLIAVTVLLLPFVSLAESLSDLNVKGFQERVSPKSGAAKNPFVQQKASPSDLIVSDLNLTGIIASPSESYALISGFIVREDDEIAGFKVKVIEKDHVVLRQLDQVKILRLE